MKLFPEYYDSGALRQVAILLYEGWGYNLFKVENQMRADSLLIRSKVSHILGLALASLKAAESDYRREKLPPPSRESPRPDGAAVLGARIIESLVEEVSRTEGLIRSAPAPEKDRITERHKRERDLLTRLIAADEDLIGKAEILRRVVERKSGVWLIENEGEIKIALALLAESVAARSELLAV
jgi:hypothetical protein